MNRKLRLTRSIQKIKEKQINFLLEEVEKNLEEYKKALQIKDKQLSNIKKILQGAKKSYDTVVNENTEFKIFLKILNKGTNSTKNNNKKNILTGKDNNLGKNKQKNIKNLSARKEVTVNLKWKRVNTYLKKKRRLWNEK